MKGLEMLQGNTYDFSIVQIRGNVQIVSMGVPGMTLPMAVEATEAAAMGTGVQSRQIDCHRAAKRGFGAGHVQLEVEFLFGRKQGRRATPSPGPASDIRGTLRPLSSLACLLLELGVVLPATLTVTKRFPRFLDFAEPIGCVWAGDVRVARPNQAAVGAPDLIGRCCRSNSQDGVKISLHRICQVGS
jgi:hypothetical protein